MVYVLHWLRLRIMFVVFTCYAGCVYALCSLHLHGTNVESKCITFTFPLTSTVPGIVSGIRLIIIPGIVSDIRQVHHPGILLMDKDYVMNNNCRNLVNHQSDGL